MDKNRWYENRIRWRVLKRRMLQKNVKFWEETSEIIRDIVQPIVFEGNPVLVAFGDQQHWTVITSKNTYSKWDNDPVVIPLDEIEKKLTVLNLSDPPKNEDKLAAYGLLHKPSMKRIWTPKGGPTFQFLNLLHMFPLGHPE